MTKTSVAPPFTKLINLVLAIGLTALIGWYSIDLANSLGLNNWLFWFWAWFAWLGWVVVLVELLHIPLDLGERIYRAKSFEKNGQLYVSLGVRYYKKFAPNGNYMNRVVRLFKPNYKIIKDAEAMRRWLLVTQSKETGHTIHLVMVIPALVNVLLNGWYQSAASLVVLTVLFDLYPVMLQRYNRFRIQRTLEVNPESNRILF